MRLRDELYGYILENFLYGEDRINLADDTSFLARGVVDSTGVIELSAFVEERFGIHVEDEELIPENFDSIRGLVNYIEKKTNSAR